MSWVNRNHPVPFVSQGSDTTACWVACVAMLMHHKQGQAQRLRPSTELITMFRQHLTTLGVNIPGTIQPADITRVANALGFRVQNGSSNPSDLANAMRSGPVAIFGQYLQTPGTGLQHATVAFKLAGKLTSTADLYIYGFDPQVSQSPGTPYRYEFMRFHDPSTPNMSVCRQIDYFMY